MAIRISSRQTRFLSGAAVVVAWYLASCLAFFGAEWLMFLWARPSSPHAAPRFDVGTASALGLWLSGLVALLFTHRRIDRQVTQLLTGLTFAVSWYACSAMTIDWFSDPSHDGEIPGFLSGVTSSQATQWWFYALKLGLIGSPGAVWLLTFVPPHRRVTFEWPRRRTRAEKVRNYVDFLSDIHLAGTINARPGSRSYLPPGGDADREEDDRERLKREAEEARFREDLKVLGLKRMATREEIRSAYIALVQVWHPDRLAHNPGRDGAEQTRMSEINAAHDRIEKHLEKQPRV
ncbi:DnaJ domain-containing protein [Isosphaeraceae bacterium EP7]